jgi:hypothetical protein
MNRFVLRQRISNDFCAHAIFYSNESAHLTAAIVHITYCKVGKYCNIRSIMLLLCVASPGLSV